MNLPAPKWFASVYAIFFGIFLVAGLLGIGPVAIVAWFCAKIMFFGLAVVVAAAAVLGLVANLIPSAVPTTKQRICLAITERPTTDDGATFVPLHVYGPGGYSVTVQPTQNGPDEPGFNSYVYDVPMPDIGIVRITPGNQPTAALDAAVVTQDGAVKIHYARVSKGRYSVCMIQRGGGSSGTKPRGEAPSDGRDVFGPPI
jgi:hypothetical protein